MNGAGTRRILLSETRPTPWKNGGGVTREIAVGAAPGSDLGWGWRFSIAEVERDGPFSIFVGVDRIISVIAGEGMDLRHADGSLTPLEPFQPVRISGEELLFGRLRRGPVHRDRRRSGGVGCGRWIGGRDSARSRHAEPDATAQLAQSVA